MFLELLVILSLVVGVRAYAILPRPKSDDNNEEKRRGPVRRKDGEQCSFAVFLGSGGHTSEALTLVSALDFTRYSPRTYIISEGDTLSAKKAMELEQRKEAESTTRSPEEGGTHQYTIITLPRARKVHQSLISTPPTFLRSFAQALRHIFIIPAYNRRPFADVLLVNGPGTCVSVVLAALLSRFFFLPSPRIIYVESFARVTSLSLSGKILRRLVDRMIVQWPEILHKSPGRGEYHGCLV